MPTATAGRPHFFVEAVCGDGGESATAEVCSPEGGSSIPYWMEDPFIRREYEETLRRNGADNRMKPEFYDKNYKGALPKE